MTDPNEKFITNAQALAGTRKVTVILLAIALAIAYWVWPSGITDLTLASITFGSLLRAIGSAAIAGVACWIAFFLWIE